MLTDTNNMFSNRVFRKILRETNIMNVKSIHKITFKKPKRFKEYDDFIFHTVYNVNDKIVLYIKPYFFYSKIFSELIPSNYKSKGVSYYENIYFGIINHITYICRDTVKNSLLISKLNDIKTLSDDYKNIKHFFEIKNNNNFNKTTVNQDFWAIIKFCKKQIERIWKKKKKKDFEYSIARFLRVMRSGFKGLYTFVELKRKIFGNENVKLYSDYKLRKIFNSIHKPIVFKSKFKDNAKAYHFYDENHYKKFIKQYSTEIKMAKLIHSMMLDEKNIARDINEIAKGQQETSNEYFDMESSEW